MKKPTSKEIERSLARWAIPPIPEVLSPTLGKPYGVSEMGRRLADRIKRTQDMVERSRIAQEAADWLYDLVRRNIKRGRVFQLSEVLREGYADCVGYASLFHILGSRFGLDIGVVEVVVDNGGRYVPHCANLFTPPLGGMRFIDLWYGSKDIGHRRPLTHRPHKVQSP